MRRSATRLQVVLTGVIALAVLIVTGPVSALVVAGEPGAIVMAIVVAVVLSAAAGISIAWPGVALGVAWAGAILQMLAALPVLPANLSILMVLYATGAAGARTLRILGAASAVVGALVAGIYLTAPALFVNPDDGSPLAVGALLAFATLVTLILSWTFGVLVAAIRRGRAERAAATAAQLETIAEQERGRIARDMHDVVAHSLGVIVAQADGARYLAAADPDRAGAALGTIAGVAREALGDVRLLLARLRHQQGDLPQPGLADVDALLAQFREAGLRIEGAPAPMPEAVPAGVQLAVYRILQESLTNALRHGDRARPVRLAIDWSPGEVRLVVASALPAGGVVTVPGHGITGMRERARLAGGEITAEAVGDEFVVTVSLPRADEGRLGEGEA